MKKTIKRALSLVLAVLILSSMACIVASANNGEKTNPLITDVVSTEETNTFYFYMPEEWRNEYNDHSTTKEEASAGIYWWEGTDNCNEHTNTVSDKGWPGYRVTETVAPNVFVAKVPKDVSTIIWNNTVDGGEDSTTDAYKAAVQTANIPSECFAPKDIKDAYGVFPDGKDSFDGMIFVCDPDNISVNEFSGKATYNGSWFYYYGNGEYGVAPTKEAAGEDVYTNGVFPQLGFSIDKEEMYVVNGETDTITMKNYDEKTVFSIVEAPATEPETTAPATEPETTVPATEPETTVPATEPEAPTELPTEVPAGLAYASGEEATEATTEAPTEATTEAPAENPITCEISVDDPTVVSIATIENGVVTVKGLKDGITNVNFNYTIPGETDPETGNIISSATTISKTCKIQVFTPEPDDPVVPAETKISVKAKATTIYVKKTTTVTASVVNPNGTTKFSSSNTKVATVDSKGKVTAKKAGKTTITATNNGKSAKVTITVKNPTVKAKKKTIKVKKSTTISVKNAVGKTKFKALNKFAKVTSKGKVTGKKKGTAKIQVTASGVKFVVKIKVKK